MTSAMVEAWNLLGGEVQWAGIEPICEMLGIDDPELLIRGLVQVRDHFRAQQ